MEDGRGGRGRTLGLVADEDDVLDALGLEVFVEVRAVKAAIQG